MCLSRLHTNFCIDSRLANQQTAPEVLLNKTVASTLMMLTVGTSVQSKEQPQEVLFFRVTSFMICRSALAARAYLDLLSHGPPGTCHREAQHNEHAMMAWLWQPQSQPNPQQL
jgi:hypothetical protein